MPDACRKMEASYFYEDFMPFLYRAIHYDKRVRYGLYFASTEYSH